MTYIPRLTPAVLKLSETVPQQYTGNVASAARFGVKTVDTLNMSPAGPLTGTAAYSSASAIVTGTGSLYLTELAVGTVVRVSASVFVTVLTIQSNTQFTATANVGATGSGITISVASRIITCQRTGRYLIQFGVNGDSPAATYTELLLSRNGSRIGGQGYPGGASVMSGAGTGLYSQITEVVDLTVGDTIAANITMDGGANVNQFYDSIKLEIFELN